MAGNITDVVHPRSMQTVTVLLEAIIFLQVLVMVMVIMEEIGHIAARDAAFCKNNCMYFL